LEPHSRSLLIGFYEDHASLFQSHADHGGAGPLKFMLAALEPADRAATDAGTHRQVFLGPIEECTSGTTLFRAQHDQDMRGAK
jgi:hypothetical protein